MDAPGQTPPDYPRYQPRPQVRFDAISEAWKLFQQQMGTWVVALIVAIIVYMAVAALSFFGLMPLLFAGASSDSSMSFFSGLGMIGFIGMLAVSMLVGLLLMGGLMRMAIKQTRGEPISVGDIFSVVDVLGPLLVASIVISILVSIGSWLCYIPGLVLQGLFMFAIPLIVDARLGPFAAILESFKALQGHVVMATVFNFVLGIVSCLGIVVLGVGILFTAPLYPLAIAVLYRTFYPEEGTQPGS